MTYRPAGTKGYPRRVWTGSSKGESGGLKIRRGWFDSGPVHQRRVQQLYFIGYEKAHCFAKVPRRGRGRHNAGEAGCNPGEMQSMVNLGKLAELVDSGGLLIR